jgi:hypothetical protein
VRFLSLQSAALIIRFFHCILFFEHWLCELEVKFGANDNEDLFYKICFYQITHFIWPAIVVLMRWQWRSHSGNGKLKLPVWDVCSWVFVFLTVGENSPLSLDALNFSWVSWRLCFFPSLCLMSAFRILSTGCVL